MLIYKKHYEVMKGRDGIMSETEANYIYEVKDRNVIEKLEKLTVSKEMKKRCQEVAKKYLSKKQR